MGSTGAQSGKHVVSVTHTQRGPPPGVSRQKQPPASQIGKHRSALAPGQRAPASVNSSQMVVASPDAESPGGLVASAPPSPGGLLLEQPLERRITPSPARATRPTGRTRAIVGPLLPAMRLIVRARYRVMATRGTF